MQFYDATNKRAICQKIDRLCDTDDTSYPRLNKTAEVNDAYEQVIGWIINADGTWQWDDTNQTDFPIGTYTLVDSQSKYSFNDKFLQLEEVQILDVNGTYNIIQPIDQKEFSKYTPLSEEFETDGRPGYYDKVSDDTIELFPAPDNGVNVTLASGLKIKFKRTGVMFTPVSTTAADATVPGIPSPFQEILAYMASIPYCVTYKQDRVGVYEQKVAQIRKDLMKHYSHREKDKRKRITTSGIEFR